MILRPFDFNTLATRTWELANEERLLEAAPAALMIVLAGLLPVILLSRMIARSPSGTGSRAGSRAETRAEGLERLMMERKVILRDLSVDVEGQRIIDSFSLELEAGEIGCLLGSSGCGKTTLLRAVAGFENPSQGEILIDGVEVGSPRGSVPVERRHTGMVFQDYALFPHLNVTDNILFGLRAQSAEHKQDRLHALLALLELEPVATKYPHRLSGGQQQRVALARAMAPRPSVAVAG